MGRGNYDCLLDVEAVDDVKGRKKVERATNKSPQTCTAALAPCKYARFQMHEDDSKE